MKPSHYVAIDPGHSGGIVMLSASGETCQAWPMPTVKDKTVTEVDKTALFDVLNRLSKLPAVSAGVEWPAAWPGTFGNVARDATAFGKGLGVLDTMMWFVFNGHKRISPVAWKQRLGLPGKTDDPKSVQGHALWNASYPKHKGLVLGPRGGLQDGILDAALICHYLRLGGESPVGHKGGRRPPIYRTAGMDNPLKDWMDNLTIPHDELLPPQ